MSELIPRDFIQLLLSRIDIVDLIDNRIPLRKKSGNNYFACCPFHQEKSGSFSVSQHKQFYHCFGCGAHGNAIDFMMQYDHLSFPEAIETLAKQFSLEVPRTSIRSRENTQSHTGLYDILSTASAFYQKTLREHPDAIQYLKQRGLSGDIAKEFMIGYAPAGWDNLLTHCGTTPLIKQQLFETGMLIKKEETGGFYDRFRERIMFPILDRRGRVIGFGGRIVVKGEPKYLNSPETPIFQKGRELYGLHHALKANRQLTRVLIVEGYMDVIALFQHGVTYAVATLGTATTQHHLERLFRHTAEIIFCFDGDDAGRTAATRALHVALPLMHDGMQIKFLFLPDGEDPDTLIRKEGKEKFEIRMSEATSLSNFFFSLIGQQVDLSSLDGRARFVKLATDELESLSEGIFKNMMLDELAKRSRTSIKAPQAPQPRIKHAALKQAKPISPLRLALMLLIQHPALGQSIHTPIPHLEMKGYDLLKEILLLTQEQSITTGGLIEFFRNHPHAEIITKLAQVEHLIPESGIESEFLGAISRLEQMSNKQVIEYLLAKASQSELSQEEKVQLQHLIGHNK